MENVKINKEELLGILKKNLETHRKIYTESMVAFKKNYIKKAQSFITNSKKGKYELSFNLTKPENHEQDYLDAIKMVDLDVRDELILEVGDFERYILNRWQWLHSFRAAYYSNISSSSSSTSSSSSSDKYAHYFNAEI